MYDRNNDDNFLHYTPLSAANIYPVSPSPYPPQRSTDAPFSPISAPPNQAWFQQQSNAPSCPPSVPPNHSAFQWMNHNNDNASPTLYTQPRRVSYNGPVEAHFQSNQGNYYHPPHTNFQHPAHHTLPSSPMSTRPTLPSPAPSEEHTFLPKRTASVSGPMRQSPASGTPNVRTLDPLMSTPRAWVPSLQAQSATNLYQQPGTEMGSSHPAQYQPRPPGMPPSHVSPVQASHPHQSIGAIQQGTPGQAQQTPRFGIPIDRAPLLSSLDLLASEYQAQVKKDQGYFTGIGRISLLKEAVEQDDMFYLVLSQLICLRSRDARVVPSALQKLPQSCFDRLEEVLSSNKHLHPSLLSWFATFPRPTDYFYSKSGIRGLNVLYSSVVSAVSTFLARFGVSWDQLKERCKARQSPPLIQEMKQMFALYSPPLQTVIFRAIGRELLRGCSGAEKGLLCLEIMHRADQEMELRGVVRDKTSLRQARNSVKLLLTSVRAHEARRVDDPSIQDFQFPSQVMIMFHDLGDDGMGSAIAGINVPRSNIQSTIDMPLSAQMSQIRQLQSTFPVHAQTRPMRLNVVPTTKDLRFFFPRYGDHPPPLPTEPQTARIGLHQSHLDSPEPDDCEVGSKAPKLFRQVSGFGFWPPWRLNPDMIKQSLTFTVSTEDRARTSKIMISDNPTTAARRTTDPHSLTWRLRCSKTTHPQPAHDESRWLECDSVWPDDTYFFIGENLQPLEPRKKLHHGRYLPMNLTSYIREGPNTLTVVINRNTANSSKPFDYVLAVEKVEVHTHQYLVDHVPDIDHDTMLANIAKSIQSNPHHSNDDDDDEIMIMSTSVTLNLRNPYTLLPFDVPVRSSRCKHFDCFDLPTYLQSAKRDNPAWPSRPDTWRCPICRCDARPSLLLKDGFFARVRQVLEDRGETNVDAIIVEADGTWRPKERDTTTGVRSASLEREEAERTQQKERVVIELD